MKKLPLLAAIISSPLLAAGGPGQPEEWFYRTDIEMFRSIDSNDWELDGRFMAGPDFHKLIIETDVEIEDGQTEEWDTSLYYGRPFGRFGLWKAGVNYRSDPASDIRFSAELDYELPYFIETETTLNISDQHIEVDVEIEREFVLTQHWSVEVALETRWSDQTVTEQEVGKRWNYIEPHYQLIYRYNVQLSVFAEYRQRRLLDEAKSMAREENRSIENDSFNIGLKLMY